MAPAEKMAKNPYIYRLKRHPDMTFAFDWVLKTNYLAICLLKYGLNATLF